MSLTGSTQPADGYALRLPEDLAVAVSVDGRKLVPGQEGIWDLPSDAREITILFRS
jgi:hypothetical protein